MTYEWVGRFGGESGLVLITDAEAFRDWTGAVYDDDYQLDPDCDYARLMAIVFADDDEVDAASVGAGLAWQMEGGGVAEVATTEGGLLVMRSWADDDQDPAPRDFVVGAEARTAERATTAELRVDSGEVTVVWSPVAASETTRRDMRLDTGGMLSIGMVAPLRPGRYTAACGFRHGDEWACRWIRLESVR